MSLPPLFAGSAVSAAATRRMRVLSRNGSPFLLLPEGKKQALRGLDLYPAQTVRARCWKWALRFAIAAGAPLPGRFAELPVDPDHSFSRFVASAVGSAGVPVMALLAGNPKAAGRRYVVMAFGEDGQPRAVVKVGTSPEARQLIEAEACFLQAAPLSARGLPVLRGTWSDAQGSAFWEDFVGGHSPRECDRKQLPDLLLSWISPADLVPLCETPAWQRLRDSAEGHPVLERCSRLLAERKIGRTLTHGDFAPWNVKVLNGQWTAVDWERGQLSGVPGWDWLHYVVQEDVLVRGRPPQQALRHIRRLVKTAEFADYCRQAGVSGFETELVQSYLLYCACVLKPTEKTEVFSELLHLADGLRL